MKVEPVSITPVQSRRGRRDFLRLPWQIYAGDPAWVPPLLLERSQFINPRRHPFYVHGAATLFVARRGSQCVGRIMASDDPRYNEYHGDNVGCFGLFESIDDPAVAHALLDAAAGWLTQRGRTAIMGPIDYSTNYPCGLLIDGFDRPPRVMMNHQPRYYATLLESWGLTKARDLYCWWGDHIPESGRASMARVQPLLQNSPFTIRSARPDDWEAEIERCKAVYHAAWQRNWGFVPMTDAEFRHLARWLLRLGRTELVLLAEHEGRTIGFLMALPDVNEAIRPLDGRLTTVGLPIGLWRLWRRLRQVQTVRFLILGVTPPFRNRGVAELLSLQALDLGMNRLGYRGVEISWILEDNQRARRPLERLGLRPYKTYRIYRRSLEESGAASVYESAAPSAHGVERSTG